MEVENVNVKNWKSLIKPSKLDVQISKDLTHAKIIAEPLEKVLVDAGLAKFRAKQVWHWVYHKGTTDFSEMTTLSIPIREELSQAYVLSRPDISQEQRSVDGTSCELLWNLIKRNGLIICI